jgi:hypothetical protein
MKTEVRLASGSVKVGNHAVSYIVDGHGRCVPGDVISKVVPGRGRVMFEVTLGGGLKETK